MALEDLTGTKYIDDLNSSNPAAGDNVSEGDDHIRGIKNVLKTTFPSIDGAITATDTELNYVDGVTSAIQTQLDSPVAKGDGSSADGYIQLNCSQNSHGIKLQSPPHSAGASYTLVFPNDDGNANEMLLTNGSGVLDWTTVGTSSLAADAVTGAKIADDAIDSEHYTDGSIDNAHIASATITGGKLVNDTITATQIAANAITASELADNAVDTAAIAADAVTGAKIADDTINSEHYVDGSIDTAHIADDQVTAAKLSNSLGDLSGHGVTHIGLDGGDHIQFDNNATMRFVVNNGEEMRLEADGDLHVDGDVIAYSTTISDATLKYDINPVEFALDKINQLKGVSYKYKHNDRESAGLLAQDVEKVMPSAVNTKKLPLATGTDKEYKTLHYDSMTAILVEAIKELTAKVRKLESK
jgi:hypothetical protein